VKQKLVRILMVVTVALSLVGVFTLTHLNDAPLALADCSQTLWVETGISASNSGAHTSVTGYLQKLVDKTDTSIYCGSLRTRLHWEFDAPNYCDSFGAAVDGQYGSGQYGVTYTSYMCSGNIMGQPSGNLYSGSHVETCGTVDGWANTDGEHIGHSGGCF